MRKARVRRLVFCAFTLICLLLTVTASRADVFSEGDHVTVIFGPYMQHYRHNPDHNSFPWFTGVEWESAARWEVGGALFRNSYYQPSGYLYGGRRWILGVPDDHLFFKLTAGALMGYVEPYEHKIPVNYKGLGLGIVPAVGYKYGRASTQVVFLGVSGVMFTVGYDLWK